MYVKGLAEELSKLGVENVIAAPAARRSDIGYGIWEEGGNKVRVWRFECREGGGDLGEIYGAGDPVAAESFKQVLNAERPDIVHFHAWSPAVSILLVREVKRRGLRMVQTYHTPTLSCPRGTLMRWGKIVCDGDLEKRPCALCAIHGQLRKGYRRWDMGYGKDSGSGIPDSGFRIQGESQHRTSPNPGSRIPHKNIQGIRMLVSKLTTMLRMPGLIRKRTEAVREMFRAVDAMVALNDWSRKLLVLNSVDEKKIRLIRHGVSDAGFRSRDTGSDISKDRYPGLDADRVLRLVFLGRVAPEKGIDVLLRAMEMVKIPVELDVYGIGSDIGNGISDIGNAKVRWLDPVKPEKVVETIRKYDALVVPSVWLETGPLVVLEAFAAGVPVIGSRLGGIAEMVRGGVDGLLFEPNDETQLALAIKKIESAKNNLKSNISKPKTTGEVASQHLKLYKEIVP